MGSETAAQVGVKDGDGKAVSNDNFTVNGNHVRCIGGNSRRQSQLSVLASIV